MKGFARTRIFSIFLMLVVFAPILVAMYHIEPAAAVEEGALYAEDAPPGSAFVRVFNGSAGKTIEDISLGGKNIKPLAALESSAYVYLPAGSHVLTLSGKKQNISMREGEFYTVIVGDQLPLTVIKDETFNNRRKALVSFYNLVSKKEVDLKTADGSISIIEDVGFLANKTREINPVRLAVTTVAGDTQLAQADPVSLQWGKVFSLFACGDSARPTLVWVENEIDTTL